MASAVAASSSTAAPTGRRRCSTSARRRRPAGDRFRSRPEAVPGNRTPGRRCSRHRRRDGCSVGAVRDQAVGPAPPAGDRSRRPGAPPVSVADRGAEDRAGPAHSYDETRRLYLDNGAVPAPFPAGHQRPQPTSPGPCGPWPNRARRPSTRARSPMRSSPRWTLPDGGRPGGGAGRHDGRGSGVVPADLAGAVAGPLSRPGHPRRAPSDGRWRHRARGSEPARGFPLGRDPTFRHSSADHLHVLAEAKKIAVADRNAYVADPAYVDVPTAGSSPRTTPTAAGPTSTLTRPRIIPRGSSPVSPPAPRRRPPGASTHHISVVDAAGKR